MKQEDQFQREHADFAPWAYLSEWAQERNHPERDDEYRTRFQRDRDRILACPYFRQLSDKTQVYTYSHSDIFRRRLTHTIEVHRLALTLSSFLYTNSDLVSAIAYAHDLGHGPFGHAGEEAIKKQTELKHFNHGWQGLRVVDLLSDKYYAGRPDDFFGLNLTNEVRESILKHVGLGRVQHVPPFADPRIEPAKPSLVEGQIVEKADLIASLVADLEDAFQAGLLGFSRIKRNSVVIEHLETYCMKKDQSQDPRKISDWHILMGRLMWALMQDVIDTTYRLLRSGFPGGGDFREKGKNPIHDKEKVEEYTQNQYKKLIPDIDSTYVYKNWIHKNVVRLSPMGQDVIRALMNLRKNEIWESSLVSRMNSKGNLVVGRLIELFQKDRHLMHPQMMPYEGKYVRAKYRSVGIDFDHAPMWENKLVRDIVITDYVTSLSDMRAIDEYNRLTDPNRRAVAH